MSFGDTKTAQPAGGTQKRTQFIKLQAGFPATIRIIGSENLEFTHYVNGSTVKCLEDACPICANNKRLFLEKGKDARNDPSFIAKVKRYSVNVLDKSPVKKCKCGLEYSDTTKTTCTCGQILTSPVEASNTVKVLSRGASLFDQLFAVNAAILNTEGEPVGIDNYDITLVVSGSGKTTVVSVIPNPTLNSPVPEGLELYDLASVTLSLDPGEMLDVIRGVSVRDIFAARKASKMSDASSPMSPEAEAHAKGMLAALFGSDNLNA